MNSARPPIWVVLKANFVAQPRKTAALSILFVVMVAVYAHLFMGSGPPAAQAVTPPVAAVVMAQALNVAEGPPRVKLERPLIRELSRDPFALQLERFALDPNAVAARPEPGPAPTTQPAEPEGALVLQAVLFGPTRIACINGRNVRTGDEIDGYLLKAIEPTRVTLQRHGVARVLSME